MQNYEFCTMCIKDPLLTFLSPCEIIGTTKGTTQKTQSPRQKTVKGRAYKGILISKYRKIVLYITVLMYASSRVTIGGVCPCKNHSAKCVIHCYYSHVGIRASVNQSLFTAVPWRCPCYASRRHNRSVILRANYACKSTAITVDRI